MMDTQDLDSRIPLSSTSSSSPSSACDIHLVSIDGEKWKVGEKTTQQILSVIQPNFDSETRRSDIIKYIQAIIEDSFGVKVFPFGSVLLKTYLPDGDVDLTVVSHYDAGEGLAAGICNLLKDEEKNNASIQVKDVLYVPAQVGVVKCTVGNIAVDITLNQTAGLCTLWFLEQVNQFIGRDHLFKHSVILIKAWCYYESRLLGGSYGLISSYALETLVVHLINHFHSSLHCPLAVLHKFLTYYSKFDWETYCVSINGLVLVSSLPKVEVRQPDGSDGTLLEDVFVRSSREAFSFYTGFTEMKASEFPVKFLNILDPLRDDNNLGRCVCKGNLYRIRMALSYGAEKLNEVLTSQPENIKPRLEMFFVNTLKRNGRGRRADVCASVPPYGAETTEMFLSNGGSNNALATIQYGMRFHNYSMTYRPQPYQNMFYNGEENSISSVDIPIIPQPAGVSLHRRGKCRGTGLYFPRLEHLLQRYEGLEEDVVRVDTQTFTHSGATMSDTGGSNRVFDFSGREFPILPGSKRIPPKLSQPESAKHELIKESLAPLNDLMFGSLKYTSLESLNLSEQEKQSLSDVSVIMDPAENSDLPKEYDPEMFNSEEKTEIKRTLELADDDEFPPLMEPTKSEVNLNKDFPSLPAPLRSKQMNKWKKTFKQVSKIATKKEASDRYRCDGRKGSFVATNP